MYTILYYTANRPGPALATKVRELIDAARHPDSQTICVTHAPVDWGDVNVERIDGKVYLTFYDIHCMPRRVRLED